MPSPWFRPAVPMCAVALIAAAPLHAQATVRVETSLGSFTMRIDSAQAPVTSANFLRYVAAHAYDGGAFHRTVTLRPDNQPANAVKIEVIQARADSAATRAAPIALERTSVTGLHHQDGTVSMARSGPDTATDGFFICIGDQPELDFGGHRNPDGQGFAAFGRVVQGMEVVKAIHRAPATGQNLAPPIRIVRVVRLP